MRVVTFALVAVLLIAGCASQSAATLSPTSPAAIPALPTVTLPVPVASSPEPTEPSPAAAPTIAPAPAATVLPASCEPTPSMTEGPYYTANPPERTSLLEPGITGTRIVISGYVRGTDCRPISGARVDFWQADDSGVYDNVGYKLRGYQFTDASGRYTLETVVPGLYPGRTRHIHVKVQAPNGPILTTQLFFPNEAQNNTDSIFDPKLLLPVQETNDGRVAAFDFVVESDR